MNPTHALMITAITVFILASCGIEDVQPPNGIELYFIDEPCEPTPEWYANGPDDVSRTESYLAGEGIDAEVRFVDRGAVCLACIPECAASYLIAHVAHEDAEAMIALGWSETNPFEATNDHAPDERLFGSWQLITAQVPEGPIGNATLNIDAESIGGSAPCNAYGGNVVFGRGTISFGEIFSTLMYCENVMAQESAYFEALGAIESYRFENGRLILTSDEHTLTFEPIRESNVEFYYADTPCEENPEWYPASTADVARTEAYLADNDIEARIAFIDRGAVCRACLPACAASYLIAEVPQSDVQKMIALGWTREHPFPEEQNAGEDFTGITFTYTPVQCEEVPWAGRAFLTRIVDRYADEGITVTEVSWNELDTMVCEACYVCPTNIEYRLVLEDGEPDALVRDGWVGGPSCENTGCAQGRTCIAHVCVLEESALA